MKIFLTYNLKIEKKNINDENNDIDDDYLYLEFDVDP